MGAVRPHCALPCPQSSGGAQRVGQAQARIISKTLGLTVDMQPVQFSHSRLIILPKMTVNVVPERTLASRRARGWWVSLCPLGG